jgi:predicted ABC-type exoprotein transport system permease subunit
VCVLISSHSVKSVVVVVVCVVYLVFLVRALMNDDDTVFLFALFCSF